MYEDLLNNNGLTLNALRAFLMVADNGGYAAAAGRDPSATANLKKRVAGLSDPFHCVPLFQQQGRGIVLTPKGRELQVAARQVLQILADFRAGCRQERQLIRIGGGQSLFDELFLPQWSKIHRNLPNFRFQFHNLRTDDTAMSLREQKIDFGLMRSSARDVNGLESKILGTVTFALYVPEGLLKTRNASPELSNLPKKVPVATVGGDGEFRKKLDAFAKTRRVQFQYVMECASHTQVRTFLQTQTVAAVIPEAIGATLPGVVKFPLESAFGLNRETMLVWLPGRLNALLELETVRLELIARMKKVKVG